MWSKGLDKILLKGSTLAELLVVMVVTSILLLAVTDGLTLLGRYAQLITERVTRNGEVWADYCRLESLVVSADSLRLMPSGKVEIYREGRAAELLVRDSVLLFSREETKDTILRSVIKLDVSTTTPNNDSLLVFLAVGQNRLRIAFAPHSRPETAFSALHDLEEKYRYE